MRFPPMITRRWKIAVAVTGVVIGVYPYLMLIWMVSTERIQDWRHRQTFNAYLWRNQENSELDRMWPPRLRMVDDLVASGRLKGMTESKVVELLGPPTGKLLSSNTNESHISYYLGPERGIFGIDSETLCLSFGRDGKMGR